MFATNEEQCEILVDRSSDFCWIDCLICGNNKLCSQVLDVSLNSSKYSSDFCKFLHISTSDEGQSECKDIIENAYYCNKCKLHLKAVHDNYSKLEKIQNDLQLLHNQCMTALTAAVSARSQIKRGQSPGVHNDTPTDGHHQFQKRETIFQYIYRTSEDVDWKESDYDPFSDASSPFSDSKETEPVVTKSTAAFSSSEIIQTEVTEMERMEVDLDLDNAEIKDENDSTGCETDNESDNELDESRLHSFKWQTDLGQDSSSNRTHQDPLCVQVQVESTALDCDPSYLDLDQPNKTQVSTSTVQQLKKSATNTKFKPKSRPRKLSGKKKAKLAGTLNTPTILHSDLGSDREAQFIVCSVVSCAKIFKKDYLLEKHIKIIHEGKKYPYECAICQKQFSSHISFKDHGNIHAKLTPYSCSSCEKKFATRFQLRQHEKITHKPYKFLCEHCDTKFPTNRLLGEHIARTHSDKLPEKSKPQCEICKKQFTLKNGLAQHLAVVHSDERPHMCEICGRGFKRAGDFTNHYKTHDLQTAEGSTIICDICGKQCKNKLGLHSHLAMHKRVSKLLRDEDGSYKCDVCGKLYALRHALESHQQIHKPDFDPFRYQCEFCDFRAPFKSNVVQHQQKHNVDRNFQCDLCNKTFKTSKVLSLHKKHFACVKRPRDFICQFCQKGFTNHRTLTVHERRHRTVEPGYLCSKCGKAFRSNNSLRRHLEQRHPPQPHEELSGAAEIVAPKRNYPSYRRTPLQRFEQASNPPIRRLRKTSNSKCS